VVNTNNLTDGGVNLILKINDKLVCDSKAEYGGEGHTSKTSDGKVWETIRATSTCEDPVKVTKGDKVYMQANYDVGLHPSYVFEAWGSISSLLTI
jgi:hypothetical protein